MESARRVLAEWNQTNPDTLIRINPAQIMSRVRNASTTANQRMQKQTPPPELRALTR